MVRREGHPLGRSILTDAIANTPTDIPTPSPIASEEDELEVLLTSVLDGDDDWEGMASSLMPPAIAPGNDELELGVASAEGEDVCDPYTQR